MSVSRQGGRRSWSVLSQLRQSSSSSLPRSPPAHLGLQVFRFHGYSLSSSSCWHRFNSTATFSTAAEATHMANLANPEPVPPVDSFSEKHEVASSAAMDGEQGETELKKMLEEHKELVSSLRAELEDQKILTKSILDEIRVLKSSADAKTAESVETAESRIADKKQQCLEWTAFMEHLESFKFFEDEDEESSSDTCNAFDDPICVKRAIYKFSRAHESVFESLSPIDLRIIARHGSSANDPKASAAQKRLRQFLHLEDLSSNAGAVKSAPSQPKLSDVTRLLYSTILDGTFGDDMKSSISHLLREIVSLSKRPSVLPVVPLPAGETSLNSKLGAAFSTAASNMSGQSKQEKEKQLKREKGEDTSKIGSANREEPMKATGRAEARPETSVQAPQWKCPRCSFMNLDTKHRCVECSRRRPQRTYGSETVKSTDDVSFAEEDSDVMAPVEGRQAKTAKERKGSLPSLPTQGRENGKDRSSPSAVQKHHMADVELSSSEAGIGSEGSEAFSLLDGVLDSEDLSDEEQEEGKIGGLLDDSEEEQQDEGKRGSLANLFPKRNPRSSSRRGGQRDTEQRNERKGGDRPSKNKRFEDDDDNGRSKYGSVEEDSDDDDPPAHRSRRGFNSQADDYSRNRGKGGLNSFRGRGGPRGFGGGRGDSLDGRHNEGGLRGGSVYGDRDAGGRSSSWGSRPSRGKPKF